MENTQHEKLVYLFTEVIDDDEPPSRITVDNDDSEVSFNLSIIEEKTVKERISIFNDCFRNFQSKHFLTTIKKDWCNWLGQIVNVSSDKISTFTNSKLSFFQKVSSHFADLLLANNSAQGLRQTMVTFKNGEATIYVKPAIIMQNV
jgi:hypothetical protein